MIRHDVEYRVTPTADEAESGARKWVRVAGGVDEATGSLTIEDLVLGTSYDVRVRPVDDESGAIGEWTLWPGVEIVRDDGVPPDVQQVRLTKDGCLTWELSMEVLDLRGFLVRHATGADECWERAEPAHEGFVDGPPFVLCRVPKGRRSFMVKAVDWDGNESATAAVLIADRGAVDDAAEFVVRTVAQSPSFAGTKSGASVTGTGLTADQDSATAGEQPMFGGGMEPWIPLDGASPMIPYDPEADFFAPVWGGHAEWLSRDGGDFFTREIVYDWIEYLWDFEVHCGEDGPRSALTVDVAVVSEARGFEVPWRLQYRRKCSTPWIPIDPWGVWIPTDGADEWIPTESVRPWRSWPGRVLGAEVGVFQFRLLVPGGHERATVTRLSTSISSEPRVRHVTGLVVPALGGTRLPPGDAWRDVIDVRVTPVGTANLTIVPMPDKSRAKGPAVQAFQDGVAVSVVVDAVIRGR